MALTALDPKRALIVIDLQKGIVDAPTVHPTREIVERAASLANTFRRHALAVVLVNVTGGAPGRTDRTRPPGTISSPDWADLVDELDVQPDTTSSPSSDGAPSTTLGSTLIYAALASPRWCWPAYRPPQASSPRPAPRTTTAITSSWQSTL